jgi:hypothetical protein
MAVLATRSRPKLAWIRIDDDWRACTYGAYQNGNNFEAAKAGGSTLGGIGGAEAGAFAGSFFGPADFVTIPVFAAIGGLYGAYVGGNGGAAAYQNSDQIFQFLNWYWSQPLYVPYP